MTKTADRDDVATEIRRGLSWEVPNGAKGLALARVRTTAAVLDDEGKARLMADPSTNRLYTVESELQRRLFDFPEQSNSALQALADRIGPSIVVMDIDQHGVAATGLMNGKPAIIGLGPGMRNEISVIHEMTHVQRGKQGDNDHGPDFLKHYLRLLRKHCSNPDYAKMLSGNMGGRYAGLSGEMTWDQVKAKYPVYADMHFGVAELALGGPDWDGQPDLSAVTFVEEPVEVRKVRFARRPLGDERTKALLDAFQQGRSVPPVLVIRRAGELMVTDGNHRLTVAEHLGHTTTPAVVAISPRTDKYSGRGAVGYAKSAQVASGAHDSLRTLSLPSWRDRGALPAAECVIAPDLGRASRNSYLVYLYDQPHARRPSLAEAKATVEEIYGPLDWIKVDGDREAHHDPVWGNTVMFNDANHLFVVERLPRLGVTASAPWIAQFAQRWGATIMTPALARDRCVEVSEDFARVARQHGHTAEVITGMEFGESPEFPGMRLMLNGHFAVLIDGEVWDWTARQFDPGAEVPLVVSETQWRQRWTKMGARTVAQHPVGGRLALAAKRRPMALGHLAGGTSTQALYQVGSEHGPEDSATRADRRDGGAGAPTDHRRPHVGGHRGGWGDHDRGDRRGTARQGSGPAQVRLPVRLSAGLPNVAPAGPLQRALSGYDDDYVQQIRAAISAFEQGKTQPQEKERPPLIGVWTIPMGGKLHTNTDGRVFVMPVEGNQWVAVYAIHGHEGYRLAEEKIGGWLRSTNAATVLRRNSLKHTITTGDYEGIDFDYDHIFRGKRNGREYYMRREHGNIYSALTHPEGRQAAHLTVVESMNEIGAVSTVREHQRQGLATEMLRMAREDYPGLEHTSVPGQLSPNGEAWSKVVGSVG